MMKIGQVNWDDINLGNNGDSNFGDRLDFYKPNKTNKPRNQIRLITNAHCRLVHDGWKPAEDAPGVDQRKIAQYGYSFKCSMPNGGACPLCAMGNKPIERFYFGIIDRADKTGGDNGTVKIFDTKRSIVSGIKPLTEQPEYGNPIKYDIIITVNPGEKAKYYHVSGLPPQPLSVADLECKNKFDENRLVKLSEVPTPEAVQEKMNGIMNFLRGGKREGAVPSSSVPEAAKSAPAAAPATNVSTNFDFPSV